MSDQIILASGSPRRRELLALVGIPFKVIVSDAPEIVTEREPGRIVEALSEQKARAVLEKLEPADADRIVLGADTIVYAGGQVLGKPSDSARAAQMIGALQGSAHSVFTGVTLLQRSAKGPERKRVFHVETLVRVHAMSPEEIEGYIRTGEPFDKAGGYGIQGPFAAFIDSISGDYHNVVGLPVGRVYQELKSFRAGDDLINVS